MIWVAFLLFVAHIRCHVFPYRAIPISSSRKGTTNFQTKDNDGPEFNPYSDNGGTIVGIAGFDFVLIAADTRLSENYSILSRNVTRVFEVGCPLETGLFDDIS